MSGRTFSDETVMAYVDGELDDATSAEIERRLPEDDSLKARIELFARTRDMAFQAVGPIAGEEVPGPLMDAVKAMVDRDGRSRTSNILAFARSQKAPALLYRSNWLHAIAASMLVAVALSGGYWIGSASAPSARYADLAAIRDPAIIRALSEVPSGKPVELASAGRELEPILSFKLEDGTLCREFRVKDTGSRGLLSIACLEQDRWQTHLLMAANRPEEGYVPAGSAEAIDAYLASIHASSPLESSEEQQALKAIRRSGG